MKVSASARDLDVRGVAAVLRALADERRLQIVALLSQGELCVCHIEAALALSQANVSKHLAALRAAGVVETRRDGNWIHYRLAPQADRDSKRVLGALVKSFRAQASLKKDVEKVIQLRGPSACK